MSTLSNDVQRLISMVTWHPDTPLHVVRAFDALAYTLQSDLEGQKAWFDDVVRRLYMMADWDAGDGPFDEPSAAEHARTLLLPLGCSGPLNPNGEPG